MTKNKFYAVKKGLVPGIYHTWADCQKQTQGVSGAVFKSFSTQQGADQYLSSEVGAVLSNTPRAQTASKFSARRKRAQTSEEGNTAAAGISKSSDNQLVVAGVQTAEEGASLLRSDTSIIPSWMSPGTSYRLVLLPMSFLLTCCTAVFSATVTLAQGVKLDVSAALLAGI